MKPSTLVSIRLVLALLLALASLPASAQPMPHLIDPVHSRIVFFVSHDGYASAIGTFSRPTGTLWFDPQDWSRSRVEVMIDLATLDLGEAALNQRIARRDYLDVKRHPQARFISSAVAPLGPDTARVDGLLQLRGVELPVSLEMRLNRDARSAWSLRRTLGFSATTTLRRSLFGMSAHPAAVGDEVEIRIELEAVRTRRQGREPHREP